MAKTPLARLGAAVVSMLLAAGLVACEDDDAPPSDAAAAVVNDAGAGERPGTFCGFPDSSCSSGTPDAANACDPNARERYCACGTVPGGPCDDYAWEATCQNGAWVCLGRSCGIPINQCGSFTGRPEASSVPEASVPEDAWDAGVEDASSG